MDKNQPFFDPYNFNTPQNNMQHLQIPQEPNFESIPNPAMYYDQQYIYYKYLTQMLEYKIKQKEWEKLNRDAK